MREVEALVQREAADTGQRGWARSADAGQGCRHRAFEKDLADVLGLKVEIKRGSGESGKLAIRYGNFDQLDYIRIRLSGIPGG